MSSIQSAIQRLTANAEVDENLAQAVAGEILSGAATSAQIGAFLAGLKIHGEKPEHIRAFARTMRAHAAPVDIPGREDLVDTCGTGGDHSGTFNISTAAALIAAGAGARVAKHGNRAVTGKCGSADVLAALGVQIELPPEGVARCMREAGCAFFFAPVFHGAMRHAGPARREIGIRTIFNLLGPLANPAGALRQVIGVYDRSLAPVFAQILLDLGSIRAMIVHGSDGLDEITLTGPTDIAEVVGGGVRMSRIEPEDLGLERAAIEDLTGGSAEENAATIRDILAGGGGPKRIISELNAAAALVVADRAANLAEGLAQARRSIESGAAARVLEKLVKTSHEGGSA